MPPLALPRSVVHDAGCAEDPRSAESAPELFPGFLIGVWDGFLSVDEAARDFFALAAPIDPDVDLCFLVVFVFEDSMDCFAFA